MHVLTRCSDLKGVNLFKDCPFRVVLSYARGRGTSAPAGCSGLWDAWTRNRRKLRASRLAAGLAAFETFLFLDAAFNWRWRLHAILVSATEARGVYGRRRHPQELALAVLAGLAAYAVVIACRRLRGKLAAILAVFRAILSATFWMVEVISLDATDIALQARPGPVIAIAWSGLSRRSS